MNRFVLAFSLALAGLATATQAADGTSPHNIVDAATVKWGPGPAALPPGAKSALLYGDPTKPELFVMRLWLPKGFRVSPHTHPRPEILTVLSGSFLLGTGTTADKSKARKLSPGSFSALGPNMAHFAFADEDTILQISTTGPWSVTYVNPADDPRKKK